MSQATDGHMLVPGDPDQWWSVPTMPTATITASNTLIEQPGCITAERLRDWLTSPIERPTVEPATLRGQLLDPAILKSWMAAIVAAGGPPLNADIETAVSQALGAVWRSSMADEPAGTGDQPEVQRHVDIVIDGLTKRDKSIVGDADRPRLRKALDDAEKPLAGRPGADAGVGRAIGARWAGLSTEQRS